MARRGRRRRPAGRVGVARVAVLVALAAASAVWPFDAQALEPTQGDRSPAEPGSADAYLVTSRVTAPAAPGPVVADHQRALLHVLDHDAPSGRGFLRAYDMDALAAVGRPAPAESWVDLSYDPTTSTVLAAAGSTVVLHRWDGTASYATSTIDVGEEVRAVLHDGEAGRDRIVVATSGGLVLLERSDGGTWTPRHHGGVDFSPATRLVTTSTGDVVAVDGAGPARLVHVDAAAPEVSWEPWPADGSPDGADPFHPVLALRVGDDVILVDAAGARQRMTLVDGSWRRDGREPGTTVGVAAGAVDPGGGVIWLASRVAGELVVVEGQETTVVPLATNLGLAPGPDGVLYATTSEGAAGAHAIVRLARTAEPPVLDPAGPAPDDVEPDPDDEPDTDPGFEAGAEPGTGSEVAADEDGPAGDPAGRPQDVEPAPEPAPRWPVRPPTVDPRPFPGAPTIPQRSSPGAPDPAGGALRDLGLAGGEGRRPRPADPLGAAGPSSSVAAPGELLWTIGGSGAPILLSPAELRGDHWAFTGAIEPVSVRDARPGSLPWTLTGQVSDFAGGLPGRYLGWTPRLVAPGGGTHAGAPVPSGWAGGHGLARAAVLASAPAGHVPGEATVLADLDLRVPVGTAGGTYRTTLTITVIG